MTLVSKLLFWAVLQSHNIGFILIWLQTFTKSLYLDKTNCKCELTDNFILLKFQYFMHNLENIKKTYKNYINNEFWPELAVSQHWNAGQACIRLILFSATCSRDTVLWWQRAEKQWTPQYIPLECNNIFSSTGFQFYAVLGSSVLAAGYTNDTHQKFEVNTHKDRHENLYYIVLYLPSLRYLPLEFGLSVPFSNEKLFTIFVSLLPWYSSITSVYSLSKT